MTISSLIKLFGKFSIIVIVLIIVLLPIIFLLPCFLGVLENEMYIRKSMRDLGAMHFPATSKVLKTSYVGILCGNGNHCDILCLILYETEKDNPKLKKYFDEYYHFNENNGYFLHFINGKDDIDDGSIGDLYIYRQLESSIKRKMVKEDKDYFYIYTYYNGEFNGDPRCM